MKNDEILIIVEPESGNTNKQIVLMVDSKTTTYGRLIEGINHGLTELNISSPSKWKFINTIKTKISNNIGEKTLRELGFVTGTVLNPSGNGDKWFFDSAILESQLFNKRYDTEDITFQNTMKYNISNRVITEMEETVINLLSPGKPPQPARNSILDTVFPTLISFGSLYGFRMLFLSEGYSSTFMFVYMAGSVLSTFGVQLYRFFNNKSNFKKATATWKSNYENYLDRVCRKIERYQKQDVKYLNEYFPPMENLIKHIEEISDSLFSRSVNDFDFMMLRFGNSKQVSSMFTIEHDVKEEIELGVTFYNEGDHLRINLYEE